MRFPTARITAAQLRHGLQQPERHLQVMIDHGVLADPVERGPRACQQMPKFIAARTQKGG